MHEILFVKILNTQVDLRIQPLPIDANFTITGYYLIIYNMTEHPESLPRRIDGEQPQESREARVQRLAQGFKVVGTPIKHIPVASIVIEGAGAYRGGMFGLTPEEYAEEVERDLNAVDEIFGPLHY